MGVGMDASLDIGVGMDMDNGLGMGMRMRMRMHVDLGMGMRSGMGLGKGNGIIIDIGECRSVARSSSICTGLSMNMVIAFERMRLEEYANHFSASL